LYAALTAIPKKPELLEYIKAVRSSKSKEVTRRLLENFKNDCDTKEYINTYRLLLIENILQSCTTPSLVDTVPGFYKKGKSEDFFFIALKKRFGGNVFNTFGIARGKYLPYIPDFTIWLKALSIVIDVEIDEPYSTDGKPIHFKNDGIDIDRDFYFQEHDWIVIRFTERQIILQCEECISLIFDIISLLTLNTYHHFHSTIECEQKWTTDESIEMSKNDIRKKYL
jgi:very-short-patch-repair endonuclease